MAGLGWPGPTNVKLAAAATTLGVIAMPQLVVLVQNLMGVGHQRRASAICEAAVQAGWQARLVSGGFRCVDLNLVRSILFNCPRAVPTSNLTTWSRLRDSKQRRVAKGSNKRSTRNLGWARRGAH